MSAPVLELVNTTVVKGGATILHALNLTIHDGEHTAILGPNGAGKSTLMHPNQIPDTTRAKAADALARVDATHLARKMMDEMSTGEARRVLIAR